jgi:hypothetical protein
LVTIFDPAFTPGDTSYLRDYAGYTVLSVRIHGDSLASPPRSNSFQAEPNDYAIGPCTVAYMPHCDLSLFERFLGDNWCPERIRNMFIVGNNLSDYADK